jgi:hypothetical protein
MDKKMENLLQTERDKKHLAGNMLDSLGLKTISRAEKRAALSRVLKQKRKEHSQNIKEMYNRIMEDKKKKAMAKNTVEDASRILGLDTIGAENVVKPAAETVIVTDDVPLFLFWTSFQTGSGLGDLKGAMEHEFNETYTRLYGTFHTLNP